jgi:hypothetical protein
MDELLADAAPWVPADARPEISRLIAVYRDGLLRTRCRSGCGTLRMPEHGGYFSALDRQGQVIDTDKAIWIQGRFAWLLSTLYVQVEPRDLWLQTARSGIEFLLKHGFDRTAGCSSRSRATGGRCGNAATSTRRCSP